MMDDSGDRLAMHAGTCHSHSLTAAQSSTTGKRHTCASLVCITLVRCSHQIAGEGACICSVAVKEWSAGARAVHSVHVR